MPNEEKAFPDATAHRQPEITSSFDLSVTITGSSIFILSLFLAVKKVCIFRFDCSFSLEVTLSDVSSKLPLNTA